MRAFVASNDRTRLDAASRASACDHAVEGAVEGRGLSLARAAPGGERGVGRRGVVVSVYYD